MTFRRQQRKDVMTTINRTCGLLNGRNNASEAAHDGGPLLSLGVLTATAYLYKLSCV